MSEKPDMNRSLVLMALWDGGDLILQHRTHKQEGIGLFGGRKKTGEKPLDGALRETLQETGLDLDPRRVRPLVQCQYEGWEIDAFQASLARGEELPNVEGEVLQISPIKAWEDSRLMPATRAVLRETIMIPNGLIDN
jgi:8-oxo-dGTP pyrophosphatase MutT (NUDIX family)